MTPPPGFYVIGILNHSPQELETEGGNSVGVVI